MQGLRCWPWIGALAAATAAADSNSVVRQAIPGAPAQAGAPGSRSVPVQGVGDPRWDVLRKLLRASQFAAAEQVARALVKDRPDDLRAAFYLGLVLHKEKRHGEALPLLERAAAADDGAFPESPHAPHYLGWCRYSLGDLPGARAAFTEHANSFPNYDDTHFALGLIAYEEDRLPEAEASFRRALELLGEQQGAAKERAKNLARLGDVMLREDRLAEAELCYRRAVELFEQHGEAWSKLARVLDRLGRPEDAADARARQAAIRARSEGEGAR